MSFYVEEDKEGYSKATTTREMFCFGTIMGNWHLLELTGNFGHIITLICYSKVLNILHNNYRRSMVFFYRMMIVSRWHKKRLGHEVAFYFLSNRVTFSRKFYVLSVFPKCWAGSTVLILLSFSFLVIAAGIELCTSAVIYGSGETTGDHI